MTNDLTCPEERSLPISNLQAYHPLDVLYQINPEIASLAYANRKNWLNSEILPHLARFRECQTHEKVALLDSIVRKSTIDSNERIQMEVQRTLEVIAQIEQEGEIKIETIKTDGMIESQRIKYDAETEMVRVQTQAAKEIVQVQSQAALDISKLKYETDIKILEEHIKGQCYLSDNQLKATVIEAEALRDAIIFSERIRSMSEDRKTDAQLKQAIYQAEKEFMTKIYESELVRQGEHDKLVAEIIKTYILAQTRILRDSFLIRRQEMELTGAAERESYRTISEIAKNALQHSKSKKTLVRGESKYGKIEVVVERSDE